MNNHSTPAKNEAKETTCRACGNKIPLGARKCARCDSFQDWRRFLGFSTTVLALLVAFASVLTVAVPVIKNALTKHEASVYGAIGYTSVERMDSSAGPSDVVMIIVLLSNSGDRDALVAGVWWADSVQVSTQPKNPYEPARYFSDKELASRVDVPARSSRALAVYIDQESYTPPLRAFVDYYDSSNDSVRSVNLRRYDYGPARHAALMAQATMLPSAPFGGPAVPCQPVVFSEGRTTSAGETMVTLANTTCRSLRLVGWALDVVDAHPHGLGEIALGPGATVELDLDKLGAKLRPEGGTIILLDDKNRPACSAFYTPSHLAVGKWSFQY